MQVFQTSVDTLGLVSLGEVRNGHIYIANNSRLCYASSVNWLNIRMSTKQNVLIQYNRNNSQCGEFLYYILLLLSVPLFPDRMLVGRLFLLVMWEIMVKYLARSSCF